MGITFLGARLPRSSPRDAEPRWRLHTVFGPVRRYDDGTRPAKVTDGRPRPAGGAIRDPPQPPAGVAYRMLGSLREADDAVQEAWLRLSRSETAGVENLAGWLTRVVARVCLDMLRTRTSRREEPLNPQQPGPIVNGQEESNPEQEALLADSADLALLVVLDRLAPAERVAF